MPPAPDYATAVLPDGVRLAYTDSWSGETDHPLTYTTIVALHGGGCNSAAWTPVVPCLPANVRFLAYNQRSYAGSSPARGSEKEAGTDAAAAYLSDLVAFVEFAVRELGVPLVGQSGEGGLVLLAWSKSTNLPIALLASLVSLAPASTSFLSSLPAVFLDLHPSIRTHIRSILLFEPGTPNLGLPPPIDFISAVGPAFATSASASNPHPIATAMGAYVTGYASGADVPGLPASSVEVVMGLVGEGVWEPAAIGTAGWELATTPAEVGRMAKRALVESPLPVGLVYGSVTVGLCAEASKQLQEWWAEAAEDGKGAKRAVRRVQGMNHVGQVLMPGQFVQAVMGLIDELGAPTSE